MAKNTVPALHVSLTPSPEQGQAVSLLQRAQGLTIVDKVTHVAGLEFLKGAKELKRKIVAHYAEIKRPLNDAKNTVLDMERRDIAPIEEAIALAERCVLTFTREQERIEREEADRRRREAEAVEQARRDKEAAEAEAAALKLEASSSVLSEREQMVVETLSRRIVTHGQLTPADWLQAAKLARFLDPEAAARKLFRSKKIFDAVTDRAHAARIREQAEAAKAAPITVVTEKVETEIGRVAGTAVKVYYGCMENVDLLKLAEGVLSGVVPVEELQPNMPFLNSQARSLRETFPSVFPGCSLRKSQGIAG